MKEVKIISAKDIIEAAAQHQDAVEVIDFHGIEIEVSKMIPVESATAIIHAVVEASFSEETGEYLPESRLLATRTGILAAYTNIDIPEDQEELAILVYNTGLFEMVEGVLSNSLQYYDIINAIQDRCSVRVDVNRKEFEHELNTAVSLIGEIIDSVKGLFGGVSQEDLQNLMQAIDSNGIDEEALVSAVVRENNRLRGEETEELDGQDTDTEQDDGE